MTNRAPFAPGLAARRSILARRLLGAASLLFLLAAPARALAGPADLDEPWQSPRYDRDPRLDLDDRARPLHLPTPQRAPLWFAIDGSFRRTPQGTDVGAMLLVGVPLDRLAARAPRAGRVAEPPSAPPALKPPPGAKPQAQPAPPKVAPPAPSAVPPPLRIPVVVTAEAARAAVDAALKKARLAEADERLDSMATRARRAAALPELRLRALRSVDQGQNLTPTEYDPARITAASGTSFWMEARATWRLDRLVFADEEVAIERLRQRRAEARQRLTALVLKLLYEWQRALALADNPAASPEENLHARLKALEAEAEVDLLTGGWLTRWRAKQPVADGPRGEASP